MRSRRDDGLTSFDLLLDTMCNTFGGIVFIALLLTVLSQAIEVNHPTGSEKKPSDSRTFVDNTEGFFQVPDVKLSKELSMPVDKMASIPKDDSLMTHRVRLMEFLKANQMRMEVAEARIKTLEKSVAKLAREVDSLESQKKRVFRLPRLHTIKKQPIFIAIRYGKLYLISDLSAPFSGRRSNDLSEVRVWHSGNSTTIAPVPDRGETIEPALKKNDRFMGALSNVDPEREYISFAVYPDSFGAFNLLKAMFVTHGFDYNWLIVTDQFSIVRGKGGGGAQVQ